MLFLLSSKNNLFCCLVLEADFAILKAARRGALEGK